MKYYLIGIKGVGLSALAIVLKELGHIVVGYDDNQELKFTEPELIKRGIKIYTESNDELTSDSLVIKSTAIDEAHPEVKRVKELGLKLYDYHEFLGELTKKWSTIAVAGTHGKTTTTTMLKNVLTSFLDYNYLIGDGTGHAAAQNKLFLMEACEHYEHFLAYEPSISIITNVDLDHVSYYKNLDEVVAAFEKFAAQTKELLVVYGDAAASHNLKITKPVLFYGFNDDNDVIAKNVIYDENGVSFDVFQKSIFYAHFTLPFYGEHLLLNTLAVIAVASHLKVPVEKVTEGLLSFKGAKRRFQEIKLNENIIIDDYAHHPAEIEATIKATRQKYSNKKIIAIFEPYLYDRTIRFAKKIAEALNLADEAYVLDICSSASLSSYPGITSELIIAELKNGHYLNSDDISLELETNAVIVLMSPAEMISIKEYLSNFFANKKQKDFTEE